MADSRADKCVCDLTRIMRSRLLCGLYSYQAVPPHLRYFAKGYCLMMLVGLLSYMYLLYLNTDALSVIHQMPGFVLSFFGIVVSLWTGDDYIYTLFKRNKLTDVTLDSTVVLNNFQKQMKIAYNFAVFIYVVCNVIIAMLTNEPSILYWVLFLFRSLFLDQVLIATYTSKLLVMGLFNCRLLILRRRMERYGFRTVGRARPQPYCQIYEEILKGLDATGTPLKILNQHISDLITLILFLVVAGLKDLVCSFGHVALLESAAEHCQAMMVFTATELIKTPTAQERTRMYEFLHALKRRGARYGVLRALPLDAQLALRTLGFCSAQAIVFLNML